MAIPSLDFSSLFNDGLDFFLSTWGKSCTLIFEPKRVACANCAANSGAMGGVSKNIYQHGGPAPFNNRNCVACGGNGYHEEDVTDTIALRVYWNKKEWIKVANIVIPDAQVQVVGSTNDLAKFRRANEIILVNEQGTLTTRYKLIGDPVFHGMTRGHNFIAFLKEI